MFGETRLDVITRGEYVERGATIRIVEAHGNRIIVRASKETATGA
jgi:membrane-bound ClpP family serine protease